MKYAIILPDGAADEPLEVLGGRTPLEAADIPNIDWVARNGRMGRVRTVPEGFTPGSDVATLSLFGCDPRREYAGRAPIEAAAQGIEVGGHDLVFRCNLVTLVDDVIEDFTAGHITTAEASVLIARLNETVAGDAGRFHAGMSYRHLLVLKDADDLACECVPPHDIIGQSVVHHRPRGNGADRLMVLMARAHAVLDGHEVNSVRRDLGENPATDIWLWGQGRSRRLQPFADRYGVSGAVIAAVGLIRGLARMLAMDVVDVEGATGYLDTNYRGKGEAAVAALDTHDLVVVHIEAPDEAGHNGDATAKVLALERIDTYIVGPVLEKLRQFDEWKVLVVPDHPTPVAKRTHTADPPPFCMAGTRVRGVLSRPFTEAHAAESDLHVDPGHALMEYFLKP